MNILPDALHANLTSCGGGATYRLHKGIKEICINEAHKLAAYTYQINSFLKILGCLYKILICCLVICTEESMRGLSISQAPECISLAGINFQRLLQLGFRICNKIQFELVKHLEPCSATYIKDRNTHAQGEICHADNITLFK